MLFGQETDKPFRATNVRVWTGAEFEKYRRAIAASKKDGMKKLSVNELEVRSRGIQLRGGMEGAFRRALIGACAREEAGWMLGCTPGQVRAVLGATVDEMKHARRPNRKKDRRLPLTPKFQRYVEKTAKKLSHTRITEKMWLAVATSAPVPDPQKATVPNLNAESGNCYRPLEQHDSEADFGSNNFIATKIPARNKFNTLNLSDGAKLPFTRVIRSLAPPPPEPGFGDGG